MFIQIMQIFTRLLGIKESDAHGCSVTGGYIYRGSRIPWLYGYYVFGDYCTGKIWAFKNNGEKIENFIELTNILNLGSIYI